jgi:uncharacterized Zn finger protein (UPF0148 family)
MVEATANKYTEEWAAAKCVELNKEADDQYVEMILKDGSVFCPYEWTKFQQVKQSEDEENKAEGEEQLVTAGFVFDFVTTNDQDMTQFPHKIEGMEDYEVATCIKAMEYFEKQAETGEPCLCPPPLKKRAETKDHLEHMLKTAQKSVSGKDQGHWFEFVMTMSNGVEHATSHDLLLKVMNFANKLQCDSLLRLCAMRTVDIIYESTAAEARAFLGFKNNWTPEEEAESLKKHPWPHKQA